jgi:hypothetical protein
LRSRLIPQGTERTDAALFQTIAADYTASLAMRESAGLSRLTALTAGIDEQNAKTRALIALSLEALRLPMADTFLGRRTQEPFLREGEN